MSFVAEDGEVLKGMKLWKINKKVRYKKLRPGPMAPTCGIVPTTSWWGNLGGKIRQTNSRSLTSTPSFLSDAQKQSI